MGRASPPGSQLQRAALDGRHVCQQQALQQRRMAVRGVPGGHGAPGEPAHGSTAPACVSSWLRLAITANTRGTASDSKPKAVRAAGDDRHVCTGAGLFPGVGM
jgi:hypothetical protein